MHHCALIQPWKKERLFSGAGRWLLAAEFVCIETAFRLHGEVTGSARSHKITISDQWASCEELWVWFRCADSERSYCSYENNEVSIDVAIVFLESATVKTVKMRPIQVQSKQLLAFPCYWHYYKPQTLLIMTENVCSFLWSNPLVGNCFGKFVAVVLPYYSFQNVIPLIRFKAICRLAHCMLPAPREWLA